MFAKSPRIRRNELLSKQGEDSPRSVKSSPRAPYNKALIGAQMKKRRIQGNKKKLLGAENKENVQLLELPRAIMLTPSSSDNSLSTSVSRSGVPVYKAQPKPERLTENKLEPTTKPQSKTGGLPPYLTLKRQQTAAMLNYRARKSVSQMDFKEARRTGNYQLVAHVSSSNALVPAQPEQQEQTGQLTIKNEHLTQLLLQGTSQLGSTRFVVNGDQDLHIASLRIFNTIMLRSWRRRRQEVRHLTEQVEDFKRNFVKSRNQLHVYNTLFAVEKRRNETLNDQLKQSYMDSAKTKVSYNELTLLLGQTNEEKQQLAKDNAFKAQEIENLQEMLQATKKELFLANTLQREQLEQLARVQLECQGAKFDIEELTSQLQSLRLELTQKQEYVEKLRDDIALVAEQLKLSNSSLVEYKCETELHIGKLMKHTEELEKDIKEKEVQIQTLENCLAATVGHRIRQCFAQSQVYQQATFRLMHLVAYCMLPGTPPPALPMASIPGAVKKLRGLFPGGSNGSHKVDAALANTK
ncbi:uncharacterized protein LOC6575578 [Drosophila mojavensis]|uniref:Uncharacterized protein n=1 Tax=Drosophila mojavensis TaxID=7230 RepID=B4KFR4_DROMO|nr:uncharacterized protein LOC6575578 [Drosophila mojavensis]EDW11029.1 uncharacterized protein Dmoj_GI16060 [Drosophila mojavensis]